MSSEITGQKEETNTATDLGSVFLQHLQDVIVRSLSSNVQRSHEAETQTGS